LAARQQDTAVAKMIQPVHNLPVYELATEEGLEIIHQTSMEILSEIGIAFYDDESQAILKENGVEVRDDIAYFDPAQVEELVAKAPSTFTQLARNPDNNVIIGGNHMCFAPVYGPPFVHSLDRGRREATLADFQNFVKLAYLSNNRCVE
jgi:trimethylamine--corrinoid protein Co-methyltransferase